MASPRQRLDEMLVEQQFYADARSAAAAVMAGAILVDGQPETKPGTRLKAGVRLSLRGEPMPYASRGGLKLAHALDRSAVDVTNRVCLDAGASTGGFTDCLLQHGARHVHAVDVGYGQLRGYLAADDRVSVYERTNVSDIGSLAPEPDFCSVDLSYLSLTKALPILRERLGSIETIALVKPLYEGLAEDAATDPDAILSNVGQLLRQLLPDFPIVGLCRSPIPGGRGALECLIHVAEPHCEPREVDWLTEQLAADWGSGN